MTRLDDIKFSVHLAVFEAIEAVLNKELDMHRKVWIQDKHLPDLLPALDRAIEAAMREVYDLMPESLDVPPEVVERTRQQMVQSLANIERAKKL